MQANIKSALKRQAMELVVRWIRPEIRALAAYYVPDANASIKLDAMENPYGWPDELVEAWLATLRQVSLNRYPDPNARLLKQGLRDRMGISSALEILLGNGSDELIQMICLALSGSGRVVLAPEPSFVMYRIIAQATGMSFVGVSLRAHDFGLDMPAMQRAIAHHQPAVVFLAYPNNPTGNLFREADVRALIECAPGLVVVDEAYFPFARCSFMQDLSEYPNLLLLRTVSKMGLAGLRLGLMVGRSTLLAEMDKTRLPYNINVLTQASALFALQNGQFLEEQTRRICTDREHLLRELDALPGITPFASDANFILFRTPQGRAETIYRSLLELSILVKNLSPHGGLLTDCLRVTVGKPEENEAFLQALRTVL
jgi:histidinol-phosphate aminotransferase